MQSGPRPARLATMTRSPTPARHRVWLVLILSLLGAGFRFVAFGTIGLSHFDEGVYASAGFWAVSPVGLAGLNPEVIAYAPPGYPILVGLSYGLLGVSDSSAILVSALCGVAAIPVLAWVAGRIFGPVAGVSGAALAAFSMPHIAFSRKALTDVPFLLVWLAAIGLGGRFLEKPRFGRALALGVAVGLAQNFKYNGWLAGAIVILAALIGPIRVREERGRAALLATFGWGAFAVLAAAGVYLPWFLFVERQGGYSALLRHHRSYLRGLAAWWPNWNQQMAQGVALSGSGVWCLLAWFAIVVCHSLGRYGTRLLPTTGLRDWSWLLAILFVGGLIAGLLPNAPWWLGLAWSPFLLASPRPATRMIGVWWLLLSILTPFYHPYARLWLPLHGCGWIIAAGCLSELDRQGEAAKPLAMSRSRWLAVLAALVLAGVHQGIQGPRVLPARWVLAPDPSFRRIVVNELSRDRVFDGKVLRVLARRPFLFYRAISGPARFRIQLEPGLEGLAANVRPDQVLLLDLAMVPQGSRIESVYRDLNTAWNQVGVYEDWLDPVTLLDVRPDAARAGTGSAGPKNQFVIFLPKTLPNPERSQP